MARKPRWNDMQAISTYRSGIDFRNSSDVGRPPTPPTVRATAERSSITARRMGALTGRQSTGHSVVARPSSSRRWVTRETGAGHEELALWSRR
ncbi:uncharacterized protein ATNIH1004_000489 [Aspergillus tanneri]|uniref:Uncharacterized protein n=1 Tax=Aspergillus tanneri TaxID=1220188 RepID=A0A5M9N3L3_9EURO|nr:uncharacterized protein ATNIH1004_000489 [Aspergillus tanneri]KAA8651599.1 hypothetical protein ATNIH1004_000489 [Aspergillus tanneri]